MNWDKNSLFIGFKSKQFWNNKLYFKKTLGGNITNLCLVKNWIFEQNWFWRQNRILKISKQFWCSANKSIVLSNFSAVKQFWKTLSRFLKSLFKRPLCLSSSQRLWDMRLNESAKGYLNNSNLTKTMKYTFFIHLQTCCLRQTLLHKSLVESSLILNNLN